jgi:hypothetical protein
MSTVVDCAGGQCYGVQSFCKQKATFAHGQMAVIGIYISQISAHQQQATCPAGYNLTGYVQDCGGGVCWGNQAVCVQKAWMP